MVTLKIFYVYTFIMTIYGGFKMMEGVFKHEARKQKLCKDTEQKA